MAENGIKTGVGNLRSEIGIMVGGGNLGAEI
jgi:hypothetical protein